MDHPIPTGVTPDHGLTAQLPVAGTASCIHTLAPTGPAVPDSCSASQSSEDHLWCVRMSQVAELREAA